MSTPAEQIKAIKTKKKKTYIHHEDTIYYVDTCKNDLEEEKICLIRVGNYNSKKKEIQTFDKGLNIRTIRKNKFNTQETKNLKDEKNINEAIVKILKEWNKENYDAEKARETETIINKNH